MARLEIAHPSNSPGSLFVDTTCIDCGTCYHLAPTVFAEAQDERSFVKDQPVSPAEWIKAKRALVSCPTNSIGIKDAPPEFLEAQALFPLLISDNVYYCGYTARSSYGASSYFIETGEGNILIDSPRFHPHLVKELESRGGVRYMILTHRDDVADHEKFAAHFGCERIIHQDEMSEGTRGVERPLDLDAPVALLSRLLLVPVPGHTKGHIVILYKDKFLFTGDHLFWNPVKSELYASKRVCWYSWEEQLRSMESLLMYKFQWVLPGHGGWVTLAPHEMREQLQDLVIKMRSQ